MLPRADLNSPRPTTSIEAPTPVLSSTDARQEVFHRLTQLAIGKAMFASVLSQFDDGSFMVRIGDTTARMTLPVGTKVGDTLSMMFIAREPRPTFLIAPQGGSATASLSAAGRLIDHLLQTARQQGESTTVFARAPLLPSASAMDPARTAAALKSALGFSGVFYESHLQDWFTGSRSAADLAREPQAQLRQALPSTPTQAQTGLEAAGIDWSKLGGRMNELPEAVRAMLMSLREAQTQAGAPGRGAVPATDADALAPPQAPLPDVEPEAARLINQQLHVLEQRHVQWRGELWPGQMMEWEVGEDDAEDRDADSGEPAQGAWTSTVRFELPTLGPIAATIRLVGERVHMQVNTASEDAAAALRAHGGELADALQAAGSPLDSLTVKRDEAG